MSIQISIVKALAILDIVTNEDKVQALQREYRCSTILFRSMDVTDVLEIERSFQDILREFKSIDMLVNAAGIIDEQNAELCVKVNLVKSDNLVHCGL